MEKYLNKNIVIALDFHLWRPCKEEGWNFEFHVFPQIWIEKQSNDIINDMVFLGWTKIHFCWLFWDFNINIKNKCHYNKDYSK